MTKVATIDTRRFLALLLIAAMLMAMIPIGVAVFPYSVLATDNVLDNEGTTGGSFTTNDSSSPPLVNSVALKNTDNSTADSMDPTVEYMIQVSITDNQTLEHLASLRVTMWSDNTSGDAPLVVDNNTCAIMTWDNTSTTWALTSMGGGTWSMHAGAAPTLTNNTGTFEFHFKPGKVARESVGVLNWDIYAYALDEGAGEGDLFLRDQVMNWYGEINTVTADVDFGSVSLGAEQISGVLSATYICNSDYSQQAKTDAQWVNGSYTIDLEAATAPGDNHFTLFISEDGVGTQDLQLSAAYQDVDGDEAITSEGGNLQDETYLWLTLGASGIPSGTYTGDIYFAIYNDL